VLLNNQIHSWYEQYKTGIFRYILSITHASHLAEDILQDTFVQLIVGGIHFDPGKERAWLYKVARNKCFDVLKRNKKLQELPVPASPNQDYNREFIEMISSLAPIEQEIVTLKIISGFSHKEISKIIGLTVAGTKKRYERAIQKLRVEMEVSL